MGENVLSLALASIRTSIHSKVATTVTVGWITQLWVLQPRVGLHVVPFAVEATFCVANYVNGVVAVNLRRYGCVGPSFGVSDRSFRPGTDFCLIPSCCFSVDGPRTSQLSSSSLSVLPSCDSCWSVSSQPEYRFTVRWNVLRCSFNLYSCVAV